MCAWLPLGRMDYLRDTQIEEGRGLDEIVGMSMELSGVVNVMTIVVMYHVAAHMWLGLRTGVCWTIPWGRCRENGVLCLS